MLADLGKCARLGKMDKSGVRGGNGHKMNYYYAVCIRYIFLVISFITLIVCFVHSFIIFISLSGTTCQSVTCLYNQMGNRNTFL